MIFFTNRIQITTLQTIQTTPLEAQSSELANGLTADYCYFLALSSEFFTLFWFYSNLIALNDATQLV